MWWSMSSNCRYLPLSGQNRDWLKFAAAGSFSAPVLQEEPRPFVEPRRGQWHQDKGIGRIRSSSSSWAGNRHWPSPSALCMFCCADSTQRNKNKKVKWKRKSSEKSESTTVTNHQSIKGSLEWWASAVWSALAAKPTKKLWLNVWSAITCSAPTAALPIRYDLPLFALAPSFHYSCVPFLKTELSQLGQPLVQLVQKNRRRIVYETITDFPNGIDISDTGGVLIGDSHSNRFHVAVFNRAGALLSDFECPRLKVGLSILLAVTLWPSFFRNQFGRNFYSTVMPYSRRTNLVAVSTKKSGDCVRKERERKKSLQQVKQKVQSSRRNPSVLIIMSQIFCSSLTQCSTWRVTIHLIHIATRAHIHYLHKYKYIYLKLIRIYGQ